MDATKQMIIEFRVTIDRKAYYISTGVRVRKNEFRLGRVVNRMDADELNERIDALASRLGALISERIKSHEAIDMAMVRDELWPSAKKGEDVTPDLLAWLGEQIEILNLAEGTMKHYRAFLAQLTEFGRMRTWADVTVENIYLFDAWLHQRHTSYIKARGNVKICDGTVYNYHKNLKALLNRAVRFGVLDMNPYDRLRGQISRGDKESVEYLTMEELARIEALSPVPGTASAKARDLFIFQAYTGMGYSDAQAFKFSDYSKVNGKWVNIAQRRKTGKSYVTQLLPPVIDVLERNGWKVPQIVMQPYNVALKNIAEIAGVTKRLSSHVARHTFATWALHNGVALEVVGKMLGQTSLKTTQRYAKVLAEDVRANFDVLEDALMRKS